MKLLVLGCGSIGKRHINNFSELAEIAAYDSNNDAVKNLKVNAFKTLDAAFEWQPDGVIIATPHDTHLTMAKRALQSGAHVLVEKPISNALAGVPQLIEMARVKTKKLHVVCNMRFHSAITVLKENLVRIGKPLFARVSYGNYLPNMRPNVDYRTLYAANRQQGGGVILDGIHEIDYLRWLFGPVKSVTAEASKISDLDVDVEDYAALLLRHQNGVRTEIHLDYVQRCKQRNCKIVGEKGTLMWRSVGKKPEHCYVRLFSTKNNAWETLYENVDEPANKPYKSLAFQFTQSILQQESDLASGDDGLCALRIALAAFDSAKTGRRVVL